jgi:hypothetical protein
MNVENILNIISSYYNLDYEELQNLIDSKLKLKNNMDKSCKIILPYYGKINENNCKGLLYNHGLYTQCTEKSKDLCSKCIKNKYGTIEDRKKYEIGKYITPCGKKEVDYNILLNRLKYNIEDVIEEFQNNNIDIEKFNIKEININEKKGRGRPKKLIENKKEQQDTIEVIKYVYKDKVYLKTNDDILLDVNTYTIVGIITDSCNVEIW